MQLTFGGLVKGIVFTEFFSMVESKFSEDMVDDIIDDSDLPSGGAYTSVGTYSHEEMVSLVVALSKRTQIDIKDLLLTFGRHLFGQFVRGYPVFFDGVKDVFSLLASVDGVIHVEVRKLYPDATLPSFEVEHHDERTLVLRYRSPRHFEDLAQGLIEGAIDYFGRPAKCVRSTIEDNGALSERFTLTYQ